MLTMSNFAREFTSISVSGVTFCWRYTSTNRLANTSLTFTCTKETLETRKLYSLVLCLSVCPYNPCQNFIIIIIAKYEELENTHIFFPVAIETAGETGHWVGPRSADESLLSRRSLESPQSMFLFQWLSTALQRRNAFAFQGTFNTE